MADDKLKLRPARQEKVPYQRFIRMALEHALQRGKP
jgi:predicted DNA binding CopG/RHH family protein